MRDDHAATCHEDGSTSIFTGCLMCRVDFVLVVPTVSYLRWLDGESAQSSFPMMPKGERELLVSGTCDECFEALFAVDTEEEERHDPDHADDGTER
jgi:hypothetical protein